MPSNDLIREPSVGKLDPDLVEGMIAEVVDAAGQLFQGRVRVKRMTAEDLVTRMGVNKPRQKHLIRLIVGGSRGALYAASGGLAISRHVEEQEVDAEVGEHGEDDFEEVHWRKDPQL